MIEEKNAIIVRGKVAPQKDYHAYQDALRLDFYYACGYCSITEIEASGIGFEIDHYYPKESFPNLRNDYDNLMWSCQKCNRYKADYFPDADGLKNGHIILRPDRCDPRDHIEPDGVLLKSRTETGEFNIQWLDLNRKQLKRLREYRERFFNAGNYIAFGIHELLALKLDRFPPKYRLLFEKIKRHVKDRNRQVSGSRDLLIREFAHSKLLNGDPQKVERLKGRREYLKELKAIIP